MSAKALSGDLPFFESLAQNRLSLYPFMSFSDSIFGSWLRHFMYTCLPDSTQQSRTRRARTSMNVNYKETFCFSTLFELPNCAKSENIHIKSCQMFTMLMWDLFKAWLNSENSEKPIWLHPGHNGNSVSWLARKPNKFHVFHIKIEAKLNLIDGLMVMTVYHQFKWGEWGDIWKLPLQWSHLRWENIASWAEWIGESCNT
jgi:hypothetical protein